MVQILIAAGAMAAALLFAGLRPELSGPATSLLAALVTAAALTQSATREALFALLRRHKWSLTALALVLAAMATTAFGADADYAWRTRQAMVHIALFALAGLALGAIAAVRGRSFTTIALVLAGIGAGLLIAAGDGRGLTAFGVIPPSLENPAICASFGMLTLISCFAAADELRRRPAAGGKPLPSLARRLLAPLAGLLTSFVMLIMTGQPLALGATAFGLLAFAGALALRARRSRVGLALVPAAAFVSIAAAALAALAAGGGDWDWSAQAPEAITQVETAVSALSAAHEHPLFGRGLGAADARLPGFAQWLGEFGALGVALGLAFVAALMIALAISKDRGRAISRGFILMSGVAAFALPLVLFGSAFAAPAPLFMLALLLGLAASFLDLETRSAKRNSDLA